MAQPLPESVKVARAAHDIVEPTTIDGQRFDIKMGPDEVMVLLAFHVWWTALSATGNNAVHMGLWRKSESMPQGTNCFVSSPDMIWAEKDALFHDTVVTDGGKSQYIQLPWPMILIRPPQYCVRTVIMTNFFSEMRLYYLLRDVNDVDLAKLMVKDHA